MYTGFEGEAFVKSCEGSLDKSCGLGDYDICDFVFDLTKKLCKEINALIAHYWWSQQAKMNKCNG